MKNKKTRKRRLNKRAKALIGIVCACIVVISVILLWPDNTTAQGIEYIKTQEDKKVDEISADLKQKKSDELKAAVDSGQIDVFALFGDAVIFGDSRALGYSTYGFFQSSHVFASGGATIKDISSWLDQLEVINPSLIFFSYGVNDMGLEIDSEEGGYDGVYQAQIEQVLQVCPDATIVVNSIIPATPAAVAEAPRWNQVDEYNEKIKSMCEKNDWIYVDNSEISQNGNANIYQADGVHFLRDFYTTWAENMILSVM